MTFYGDRFRHEDEEDIWEELKQMLLNSPSEQEIALKKQDEQAWIDSILNKAFPENSDLQTVPALKPSNSPMSPIGTLNQNSLEGFGQNSINGITSKKEKKEFPDLGNSNEYQNESFAPIYDKEKEEMLKNYYRDPNQTIVIDEKSDSLTKKKNEPKYEAEEPYLRYEDLLPDETDEEREARETRELEAFNKAWDKANGVEEENTNGVLTGGAAEISENKDLSNITTRCYNDYKNYNDPASAIGYTLGSFLTNFLEMKDADTHGADKYFHARANYDSAQQGPISELVAKIISDVRELSDADRNIREKKYTPEFSQRDIEDDQKANEEGRILGRLFPNIPAYEKLKHRMPKGFPLRYRYK